VIHYHGGPITPETVARRAWRGRHAFVSWAHPQQLGLAASVCQSFALDNGAFSLWRSGTAVDWADYYEWCAEWLDHPACDWAVIPDVIGGTEAENDALIAEWPHGHRGVPVWHLNETPDRLERLALSWPRVALGSAAKFDVSTPSRCLDRLAEVLPAVSVNGRPACKLHGLRMLNPQITSRVPLASADSTNVARNVGMDRAWEAGSYCPATKETRADVLVERIESVETPATLLWAGVPARSLFDMVEG